MLCTLTVRIIRIGDMKKHSYIQLIIFAISFYSTCDKSTMCCSNKDTIFYHIYRISQRLWGSCFNGPTNINFSTNLRMSHDKLSIVNQSQTIKPTHKNSPQRCHKGKDNCILLKILYFDKCYCRFAFIKSKFLNILKN